MSEAIPGTTELAVIVPDIASLIQATNQSGPGECRGRFNAQWQISADDVTEIGAAFLRQHDHLGADIDAGIEVGDVFIGEADAA
jgi:hypothetical protein